MDWPNDDAISATIPLPEGYRAERLKRSEIPALWNLGKNLGGQWGLVSSTASPR